MRRAPFAALALATLALACGVKAPPRPPLAAPVDAGTGTAPPPAASPDAGTP